MVCLPRTIGLKPSNGRRASSNCCRSIEHAIPSPLTGNGRRTIAVHSRAPEHSDAPMSDEDIELWGAYLSTENLLPLELEEEVIAEKEPPAPLRVQGGCYGCGIKLQTQAADAAGYVPPEKYAEKAIHRKQRKAFLCSRCISLTHGAMIPGVADYSQTLGQSAASRNVPSASSSAVSLEPLLSHGRSLLTPQQLRDQLKFVRETKSMCVMVVDVLDASGSFLSRVRDLVGGNPVVLIATKCDLLPKDTNLEEVKYWLQELVMFKKLNCLSVHLISSKQGDGVDECMATILTERMGRDVYIVGAANVGKSAFVRAMMSKMQRADSRHFDARAQSAKNLPVESAMPGTTLGLLQLGVFSSGGNLYDTPGLHLHHRMPHLLTPDELKAMHPHRRLRPFIGESLESLASHLEPESGSLDRPPPCGTFHWGSLLRIDVLEAPPNVNLVFYGTGAIQVHSMPLLEKDEILETDPEEAVAPENALFGDNSVSLRGGLQVVREMEVMSTRSFSQGSMALADVAVSGMPGWVSIVSSGSKGAIKLRLWAPKGVEVYVRPPLPVSIPGIEKRADPALVLD